MPKEKTIKKKPKYKCPYCRRPIYNPQALNMHIRFKHPENFKYYQDKKTKKDEKTKTEFKSTDGSISSKTSISDEDVNKDTNVDQPDQGKDQTLEIEPIEKMPEEEKKEKTFECDACHFKFDELNDGKCPKCGEELDIEEEKE